MASPKAVADFLSGPGSTSFLPHVKLCVCVALVSVWRGFLPTLGLKHQTAGGGGSAGQEDRQRAHAAPGTAQFRRHCSLAFQWLVGRRDVERVGVGWCWDDGGWRCWWWAGLIEVVVVLFGGMMEVVVFWDEIWVMWLCGGGVGGVSDDGWVVMWWCWRRWVGSVGDGGDVVMWWWSGCRWVKRANS